MVASLPVHNQLKSSNQECLVFVLLTSGPVVHSIVPTNIPHGEISGPTLVYHRLLGESNIKLTNLKSKYS